MPTKCIICKTKIPVFNHEGEKVALYCAEDKLPGMVDIKHKKCIVCKTKRPNFNHEGEKVALYCAEDKLPGMVDIKNKRCIVCKTKRPTFNHEGEKEALYCAEDKLPGMVDIKHKKCIVCKKRRATYGFPGKNRDYCYICKLDGCVNDPLKKCENDDCKEIAIYGKYERVRCEIHVLEGDMLLIERQCIKCKKIDVLTKEDLCVNFCNNDEIYKNLKKRIKKKEIYIEKLLQTRINKKFDYRDITVDTSCSKKRPDFGYDMDTHVVFVEVDENKHSRYACQLEGGSERRMWELYQSLGGQGAIFIRYNPDSFKDTKGKLVKISQSKREDILLKWIEHSFKEVPEKCEDMVRVKYLFYDGWKEEDIDYQKLTEKDVLLYDGWKEEDIDCKKLTEKDVI